MRSAKWQTQICGRNPIFVVPPGRNSALDCQLRRVSERQLFAKQSAWWVGPANSPSWKRLDIPVAYRRILWNAGSRLEYMLGECVPGTPSATGGFQSLRCKSLKAIPCSGHGVRGIVNLYWPPHVAGTWVLGYQTLRGEHERWWTASAEARCRYWSRRGRRISMEPGTSSWYSGGCTKCSSISG